MGATGSAGGEGREWLVAGGRRRCQQGLLWWLGGRSIRWAASVAMGRRGKESEPMGRRADRKRGVAAGEGELRGGSPWTAGKVVVVEERGGHRCRGAGHRWLDRRVGGSSQSLETGCRGYRRE